MKNAALLSALLVFVLSVSAVQAQNLVTGEVTRTYNEILTSSPKTITENVLSPAGTPVYEIRIDTNTKVVQARIYLNEASAESAESLPGGVVYSYFNLTAKNVDVSQLDELSFKFKVPLAWIEESGVSKGGVKALAYSGGSWDEVATETIKEDNETIYYKAVPNKFAIFAIAGESAAAVPAPEPEAEEARAPESGQEIVEVSPEESPASERIEEGVNWTLIAVGIAALVAALFLIPGSVLRKKGKNPWKAPSR